MSAPAVWQYRVTGEKGGWLADVILRADGFFATVSDWGSYAYRWTHPGMPFREFVAGLARPHDSYLCSKLERRDWFDGTQTLKNITGHICEYRRDGSMTKEEAAKEWDLLVDIIGDGLHVDLRNEEMDLHQFHQWYSQTSIDAAHEFGRYDFRPDVRAFCAEVMPRLAALIRAELAAEATRDTRKDCTCTGSCNGADRLGTGWKCALEPARSVPAAEPPAAERAEWSLDPLLAGEAVAP